MARPAGKTPDTGCVPPKSCGDETLTAFSALTQSNEAALQVYDAHSPRRREVTSVPVMIRNGCGRPDWTSGRTA